MSDGDALLRAILLKPDDDTARLVYADWLEDVSGGNDAARAEFVRVQCELARLHDTGHGMGATVECPVIAYLRANQRAGGQMMPKCRKCEDTFGKEYRERELLTDIRRREWGIRCPSCRGYGQHYGPVMCEDCDGTGAAPAEFRRGFVAEVPLTLAAFMAHAEALFRAHPIERVTLTDRRPEVGTSSSRWFGSDDPEHLVELDRLPMAIYERVESDKRVIGSFSFGGFDPNCYFPNDVAHELVSCACVAYGRSLAGLSACRVNSDHAAQTE